MKLWRYLKSSPCAIAALVVCLVVGGFFALILFLLSQNESPEDAFRRVVAKPIPASVRNIVAKGSGGTQLAGGWDFITFELSAEDFPRILARHKFAEKNPESLINPNVTSRFTSLDEPTYFQAAMPNNNTTYTIKTNTSRTVVQYYRERF